MIISGSMAIVTGARSGIGQSFTEYLLQKGATVYGLSRNLDRMHTHKESLGTMAEHYHPVQMDISDHDAIESWVNEEFKVADIHPDILINNAGVGYFDQVEELRFDGIKVSCFFPGSIATRFFDHIDWIEVHDGMMHPDEVANTLIHVLETSDNFLINEITMRPLQPKSNS